MKSLKSTVKSLAKGAVISAGLLLASSVFAADHHGRGEDNIGHDRGYDRGHEWQERHFDRDHDRGHWGDRGHDWDRRDYDRGGLRLVLPLPPHPRFVLPFLPPPPIPVFVTYAQVVDVDPIITRVPDYRRDRDGDGDYGRRERYDERIDGYRVTYLFRGREYSTVMSYDPGQRIRIRVGDGIEVLQ